MPETLRRRHKRPQVVKNPPFVVKAEPGNGRVGGLCVFRVGNGFGLAPANSTGRWTRLPARHGRCGPGDSGFRSRFRSCDRRRDAVDGGDRS